MSDMLSLRFGENARQVLVAELKHGHEFGVAADSAGVNAAKLGHMCSVKC
jgi:hypothetical protein